MRKIVSAIYFFIILLVVPFCFYCEMKMGQQIRALLSQGIKVRHEGMELILVFAYGVYSFPFLFWLATIYMKDTTTDWKKKLAFIFIFGVLPALFIYFLFFKATFK